MPNSKRPTQRQAQRILADALAASGLTAQEFAWTVLLSHRSTFHRWIAGTSPIPAPVLDWCARRRGK